MECLLPSEIARLVFGYLEEQKCEEAAQNFLEHSPFLFECLNVARAGKKFSARVHGSSLADVLEEYCAVQSLVSEKIRKLPENTVEQLRNRVGLVEKLKVLLDNPKSGQTVAVSISVLPHGGVAQNIGTPALVDSRSKIALNPRERKRSIRFQGHENKQRVREKEDRNASLESSVETTPLDALPGLSGQDSRSTQTTIVCNRSRTDEANERHESNINIINTSGSNEELLYSSSLAEQLCNDKTRSHSFSSTSTVPDKVTAQESSVNNKEVGTSTNISPKRKLKKKFPPIKHSPLRLRKTLPDEDDDDDDDEDDDDDDDDDEGESVSATVQRSVHRALLNNTEMQEKIAENINSLIRIPSDLGSSDLSCGVQGSEDSEGVTHELNNAIKMVVDKTQEDPAFERLLEEIIGPTDEDMSSSPAAVESETDDACDAPEPEAVDPDAFPASVDSESNKMVDSQEAILPEHEQIDVIDSNDNKLIDSAVPGSSKRSIITDCPVTNNQSHFETTKHWAEEPNTTTISDRSSKEILESLTNSKNQCEMISKRHVSTQPQNQTKERQQSSTQSYHGTEVYSGLTISRKELKALFGFPEKIVGDSLHTPKSDIPLKQRLRSARRCDSNLQGSTKESSSLDRSLEDQNNKAIQFIVEANRNAAQMSEEENFPPSNGLSEEGASTKILPSVSNKTSDTLEVSCGTNSSNNFDKSTNKQSHSGSVVRNDELHDNENDSHNVLHANSTSKNVSRILGVEDFASSQVSSSDEQACGKETQDLIPSVQNVHNSDAVPLLRQQEQLSMDTSIISHPLGHCQENMYMVKQHSFTQQHNLQMQSSLLPVPLLPLAQTFDSSVGSSKLFNVDEGNSSTVIVCDSRMSFPPVFNQYLKGNDVKRSQTKKLRPIIPRPIRPKPSSFPLQLFTQDITPQYIITQVPPGSLIENNISTTSSDLMSVVNLTLPVISQTVEPVEPINRICVCTPGQCGEKCTESSDKHTGSVESADVTNSENTVHSEQSVVSQHIDDSLKTCEVPENIVIVEAIQQNTSEDCGENCNCEDASSQVQSNEVQLEQNHEKAVLDMSTLLLLPHNEHMPKPRDTPQAFIAGKACSNVRRLSLSTPRRRTSHIRALDFGTPLKSGTESTAVKKSQTSPKPATKSNLESAGIGSKDGTSPSPYKPLNNQARNVRSSLFTSPDPPSNNKDEKKGNRKNSHSQLIPIATRSPVTHLMGDWDKATGVGLIFNGVSPENIVSRNTDNRPTRLTPKTLLFSPDSENSPASDQSQTPPANQTANAPDSSVTSNLSNEQTQPLCFTRNIEANSISQKVSTPTMSIKQKLKSRAWDADLRSILSQDYEDVIVQTERDSGEATNHSTAVNKVSSKTCDKDQRVKKSKKQKESKKSSKKKKSTSGDKKDHTESHDNENDEPASHDEEISNIIISDPETIASTNKEHTDLKVNKSRSANESEQQNNLVPECLLEREKHISRKRPAEAEILDDHLSKRQKVADKFEEAAGKTVEEVLESMFDEDNSDVNNSGLTFDGVKRKEISMDNTEISCKNRNDIVVTDISPVQDNEITSAEVSMLAKYSREVSGSSSCEILKNKSVSEKNPSQSHESSENSIPADKDHDQDELPSETPLVPLKASMITPDLPESVEKTKEISSKCNSQVIYEKTNADEEENANLETPVKYDAKHLFKTFNPMTPGPIDTLFPMTPRVLSPSRQEDTPITKLLRSEPCINYSMIVTPSLPPTPNIVISPNFAGNDSPTSYVSRPTDYSSCSSYYNPSKSTDSPTKLEQELIKECTRMEEAGKESHCEERNVLQGESFSQSLKHDDKSDQRSNLVRTVSKEVLKHQDVPTSHDENAVTEKESNICINMPQSHLKSVQFDEKRSECVIHVFSAEKTVISSKRIEEENVEDEIIENASDPEHLITTFVIEKKSSNLKFQAEEDNEFKNDGIENINSKPIETHSEELPTHTEKKSLSNRNVSKMQDTEEKSESCSSVKEGSVDTSKRIDISHKNVQLIEVDKIAVQESERSPVLESIRNRRTKVMISKGKSSIRRKNSNVKKKRSVSSNIEPNDLIQQENCDLETSDELTKDNEKGEHLRSICNASEKVTKEVSVDEKNLVSTSRKNYVSDENKTEVSSTNNFSKTEDKDQLINTSHGNVSSRHPFNYNQEKKKCSRNKLYKNVDSVPASKKDGATQKTQAAVEAQKSMKECSSKNSSGKSQTKMDNATSKTFPSMLYSLLVTDGSKSRIAAVNRDEIEPTLDTRDVIKDGKQDDTVLENKCASHVQINTENKNVEQTVTKEHDETIHRKETKKSSKKTVNQKRQKGTELKEQKKVVAQKTKESRSQKVSKNERKGNDSCANKLISNKSLSVSSENGSKHETTKQKVTENEVELSHLERIEGKGVRNTRSKMKEKQASCQSDSASNVQKSMTKETGNKREHNETVEDGKNHKQVHSLEEMEKNSAIHECEDINKGKIVIGDETCIEQRKKPAMFIESEEPVETQQIQSLSSTRSEVISSNVILESYVQQNVVLQSDSTSPKEHIRSDTVQTLNISVDKERLSPSLINICDNSEKMSLNQPNDSSFCEEVSCEKSSDNEVSSSESDSEESSSDSSSDSSDDSSDSSRSQFSSESKISSVNNVSVPLDDSSLIKISEENALDHSSKTDECPSGESETALTLHVESGSEKINEILKSVSPVSFIHKDDMGFASELCEKKRRTLARLKGTSIVEIEKSSDIVNIHSSKDDHEYKSFRPQQYSAFSGERKLSESTEKYWEESSIEEFPVLHLSDSESAGNPTPHISPMKSPFHVSTAQGRNLKNKVKDVASDITGEERIDVSIRLSESKEMNAKEILSGNSTKQPDVENESQSNSENNERINRLCQTSLSISKKSEEIHANQTSTLAECDKRQFETESSKYSSNSEQSSCVNVTKLNENEIFITLHYGGDICPEPKPINLAEFSYFLEDDDVTFTGSSFINLLDIHPRDMTKRQRRMVEHSIDMRGQEEKNTCHGGKTIGETNKITNSTEGCDSNSDSTDISDGNVSCSQHLSSKVRPLDLLYEEMVKGNDSSNLSDETDNLCHKRSKAHSAESDKKKSANIPRLHPKIQRTTGSDAHNVTESIRYKSPLEMIPEYSGCSVDTSFNSYIKSDLKKCDERNCKKEGCSSKKNVPLELEEGEIIDSPVKESCSLGSKMRKGGSERHGIRTGTRRSEASEGSSHSYSSHRYKSRSAVVEGETSCHNERNEKVQTWTTSSHDDVRSLPPKKRKAVPEDTSKEPDKRARHDTCRLLKNLNIDSFLNKVHGEDTSK